MSSPISALSHKSLSSIYTDRFNVPLFVRPGSLCGDDVFAYLGSLAGRAVFAINGSLRCPAVICHSGSLQLIAVIVDLGSLVFRDVLVVLGSLPNNDVFASRDSLPSNAVFASGGSLWKHAVFCSCGSGAGHGRGHLGGYAPRDRAEGDLDGSIRSTTDSASAGRDLWMANASSGWSRTRAGRLCRPLEGDFRK